VSGLGPSFIKIWTSGSSPRSGSRNAWTRIKNINGASRLSNLWNFFGAIQIISCRDRWPWSKPGYITMTQEAKQQSMEWWHSGSPRPKTIPSAKISWKSTRLDFLESRRHPPHWLSSKGPNYQRGVLLISAGAIDGHFDGKTPRESQGHQGGRVLARQCPRLTGHLQPKINWLTWACSVLITYPVLRIWPRRTTTCFLYWRNNWKVTIFRPTRSLLPRRPGWTDNLLNFCLNGLQKLEQQAKKCIELRGE